LREKRWKYAIVLSLARWCDSDARSEGGKEGRLGRTRARRLLGMHALDLAKRIGGYEEDGWESATAEGKKSEKGRKRERRGGEKSDPTHPRSLFHLSGLLQTFKGVLLRLLGLEEKRAVVVFHRDWKRREGKEEMKGSGNQTNRARRRRN
jgi:hypothetical protein